MVLYTYNLQAARVSCKLQGNSAGEAQPAEARPSEVQADGGTASGAFLHLVRRRRLFLVLFLSFAKLYCSDIKVICD